MWRLYQYNGKENGNYYLGLGFREIEYGVYGDLIIIYPKPYSIYLRGIIMLLTAGMDYMCTGGLLGVRTLI